LASRRAWYGEAERRHGTEPPWRAKRVARYILTQADLFDAATSLIMCWVSDITIASTYTTEV
jgi:hypothetical protein